MVTGALVAGINAIAGYDVNQWQWWTVMGIGMCAYFLGRSQGFAEAKESISSSQTLGEKHQ